MKHPVGQNAQKEQFTVDDALQEVQALREEMQAQIDGLHKKIATVEERIQDLP